MKIITSLAAVLLIVMNAGCTARTAYDILRTRQEIECQKLQGTDQQECFRRSGMSYDEYQRQLKERENDR